MHERVLVKTVVAYQRGWPLAFHVIVKGTRQTSALTLRLPMTKIRLGCATCDCSWRYEESCFEAMAAGLNRGGKNLNRP